MLRIILGVTGIAFIALGLFGGKPLDELYRSISGPNIRIVDDNDATPGVTQTVEVQAPTIIDTTASAAALVAPTEDTEIVAIADTKIEALKPMAQTEAAIAVVEQPAVVVTPKPELAPTIADATVQAKLEAPETDPVVRVSAAVSDQEKSSDRNKQVELAQEILTTAQAGEPASAATTEVTKKLEVAKTLGASGGQIDSEMLVVSKDKVNMREGPSIEHPIVMQLNQGQQLMEFKREGRWIHVGAYGTSGKIGWVHQRLVEAGQ